MRKSTDATKDDKEAFEKKKKQIMFRWRRWWIRNTHRPHLSDYFYMFLL